MIRRLLALAVPLVAAVALAAPAVAADPVTSAAAAFRAGDVVHLDPGQAVLSPAQAKALAASIRGGSTPVFVAALPAAPDAQMRAEDQRIADAVGKRGVYVVVTATGMVAGSVGLPGLAAGTLARDAVARHSTDPAAALSDLVSSVQQAGSGGAGGSGPGTGGSGSSGGSGVPGGVVLALLVAGGGSVWLLARRRRRAREAAQLAEVRGAAAEDVTALGEDIARLDLDVSAPGLDEATRADYGGALDAYDRAKQALERAERPAELAAVSTALEEGRWRMECVRARQAGAPVPQRRPPCFFNPRHGPSTTDVQWAPAGGAPRSVPVCAADADRLARGEDPDARQVVVAGQRVPYWQAGPAYGPWAGGWYGGWDGMGTGLLGGLLVGELLSPGPAWGGGYDQAYAQGYDSGQDNGDFGGGDF